MLLYSILLLNKLVYFYWNRNENYNIVKKKQYKHYSYTTMTCAFCFSQYFVKFWFDLVILYQYNLFGIKSFNYLYDHKYSTIVKHKSIKSSKLKCYAIPINKGDDGNKSAPFNSVQWEQPGCCAVWHHSNSLLLPIYLVLPCLVLRMLINILKPRLANLG